MTADPATEEKEQELNERTEAFFAAEGDRAGHSLVEDSYKAPEDAYKTKAQQAVVFGPYKDTPITSGTARSTPRSTPIRSPHCSQSQKTPTRGATR